MHLSTRLRSAMDFRVQLDIYHGPLELLLHLVRRHELEIAAVPLATVTQQFLDYVVVLEELNVDSVGDFVEVASTLIEIKSRVVLPQHDGDDGQLPDAQAPAAEADDAKQGLVERLLQFKRYRDAAEALEERGAEWGRRFARAAPDRPRGGGQAEQQVGRVELWDLVCAFGRVMQQKLEPPAAATIPYDSTPVHVFMRRVYDRLAAEGGVGFADLFDGTVHKSTLIATFLAVLELVRHGHALAEQPEPYGDLLLRPGAAPLPEEPRRAAGVDGEADAAA
ncbi:MAG: ScpA family protein [Planctomycetota bacterium]